MDGLNDPNLAGNLEALPRDNSHVAAFIAVRPGSDLDGLLPSAEIDIPALYRAHWLYLVRLAVLLVDDKHSAEDVVQDAFVALHRKADELRDPAAALAYLRASVLNLARSVIRRRQVARKHLKVAEPEATPSADHDVLLRDEHRAALAAVRALPRRQSEVLVLRYWAGLSEREIAEALGISTGTVKSAASRGMATLQQRLGGML
ncbi:MAG TPA: SigE family RNA polymerase sigma factor [Jatrophihabitantaceae bacterium]